MLNEEFLSLVDDLSQIDKRKISAKKIATSLGVKNLLFFLLDMEVSAFIPAPGMPSILPKPDLWQDFLSSVSKHQQVEAILAWPDSSPTEERSLVVGIKSSSGFIENEKTCIIAFQGRPQPSEKLRHLINLLPLVATCIRFEWLAIKTKRSLDSQGIQVKKSNDLIRQLDQTRQDLQQSLYHSQLALNTRTEFLAIASHELKTPLTCIVLEASLLKRFLLKNKSEQNECILKKVESLEIQIKRMTALVDNLLDYSQVAEGQMLYDHQKNDLVELTREVVQRFNKQAASQGSMLNFSFQGPAYAFCDRSKMDQAISNLVSNAIKYGANKDISVGIISSRNINSIYVEDKGIGIPVDDHARIFDRYERSPSARKYSGFGLGLFVVKKIVDAHEGTIQVESTPDQGSKFTIHLPNQLCFQEQL